MLTADSLLQHSAKKAHESRHQQFFIQVDDMLGLCILASPSVVDDWWGI